MAKPNDTVAGGAPETAWGTWEELLLACAVNRYGTKSWDSVAIELQKRCSSPVIHQQLTPRNCERKYLDLKRRYSTSQDRKRDADVDGDDDDKVQAETVPWLEELRRLRVDELKRELERRDLSILSLQLKVKKLKEERENNGEEKSDLKSEEREGEAEGKSKEEAEPDRLLTQSVAGKPVPDEESDRENQSVNASNSTDPKSGGLKTGVKNGEKEPGLTRTGVGKPEPDRAGGTKPVREDSCNGSSDSIEAPVLKSIKFEPVSDSAALLESVAESKGEGAGEGDVKENSDVQSSASERRGAKADKVLRRSSAGDEPETDDQSAAVKPFSVEAQPFVDFLTTLRSHQHGSMFERRLESQETTKYRDLIRQHMDLETIQTRLEEGWYSDCNLKFYRDLLLLANNAITFFSKKSPQFAAAVELRRLISKQTAGIKTKTDVPPTEKPPPKPPSKQEPQSDSILLKPKLSGPIIVCRKRSSIAAKASGTERKREQTEKPAMGFPAYKSSETAATAVEEEEDIPITAVKKRSRDRFVSGTKKTKNRTNNSSENRGKGVSSSSPVTDQSDPPPPKTEKKSNQAPAMTDAKKRGVASFLNRMKDGSSSSNGSLPETTKSPSVSEGTSKGGGAEQKRSGGGGGGGKKEVSNKRNAVKKQESPVKRSSGRPPKRAAAAPPPPPPPPVSGKRRRDNGNEGDGGGSKQGKKRSRK